MKKFLLTAGIIFILIAVFSVQLKIDNDAGWGTGRIGLLAFGLIFVVLSIIAHFFLKRISIFIEKVNTSFNNVVSRQTQIIIISFIAAAIIFPAYLWFIQLNQREAGREYEYYIELAKSFKGGKLHLEAAPPPELLALDNPYDYFLRRQENIENFPWDVSLYEGKFYIYWGPVPAVLLTVFSKKALSNIGDFHLALFFAGGLFVYVTLITASFWKQSLQHAPTWLLGVLLLVIGLATPATIMLKNAKIYEAAIFGCQFFFIGGCFWIYNSLQGKKPIRWKLFLGALHWALAVGTRVIILPAALFCVGCTLIYVFQLFKNDSKSFLPLMSAISMPVICMGLCLAWYNWARFDSIFEFGLTYQLANIDYTNFQNIFSIARVSQNIDLYFAHPIKIFPRFPYLTRIEYLNSNDRLAGLIYVAPYFLLVIFPLLQLIKNLFSFKTTFLNVTAENWLFHVLIGSGLISLLIILSYYFIAMRFLEDFMPALLTATTIQIGKGYDFFKEKKVINIALIFITVTLAIITLLANFLLAIPAEGIDFAVNLLNSISKLIGLK